MTSWRRPYRWPLLRLLFLAWWRHREREVRDAGAEVRGPAPRTASAPEYRYGKVSGLTPDLRVMTERTDSAWVCCGYCSAGMACRTARTGLGSTMSATAHPIRSKGGRPHNNGAYASELRRGASRAWGVELEPLAVAEVPDRLRDGYAVVVNLDYAELPSWLRVQSNNFGHSVALFGWRKVDGSVQVGVLDPLWAQDARGAWAPWSQVRPALWGNGEHSGTVRRVAPPPAPEPDPPAPEPEPPEPPCPCPSPDHSRCLDERDVLAAELARDPVTRRARDRAWRAWTGLPQPRAGTGTFGPDQAPGPGVPSPASWSAFARWSPEPPPGTWNGDAAWDRDRWS